MESSESKVNILLVDDEPRNIAALDAVLGTDDRRLVAAGSGLEALRHLLQDDFAVILLDVRMPGLDGFETAELIRQRDRSRDTPIIFLTADTASAGLANRGYSVGAVDYILKPFDPDVLRSKVAVFVDLFRKSEQIRRQAEEVASLNLKLDHRSRLLEAKLEILAGLADVLEGTDESESLLDHLLRRCLEGSGVAQGAAYLIDSDQSLSLRASVGYHGSTRRGLKDFFGHAALLWQAIETGAPIEVPSRRADGIGEKLLARTGARRFLIAPLALRGESLGVLVLGSGDAALDVEQDTFARVVAGQASQAVVLGRALRERADLLAREQAARAEAERAQRRFAFLAEISSELASSLDAEATLPAVAERVVPDIADGCVIDLIDEVGPMRCVAVAFHDPDRREMVQSLLCDAREPRLSFEVARALGSRQPVLVDTSAASGGGPLADALGIGAAVIAPLLARGRTVGALSLVYARSAPDPESDVTLAEDLARRIALALDNYRLLRETQAAVRVRDEFFASASHDLKTPLTVIRGQTQIMQRRAARADTIPSDAAMTALDRINLATVRMTKQVEELLDVAHTQMGRPIELVCGPVDLVELARRIVGDMPSGASDRIAIEAGEPEIVGDWDERRLERVLNNLLDNALKYSPDGGPVRVLLDRDERLGQAVLRVVDEGVGIPPADLPRVFDRFHRGKNVVGRIVGTGIGLAGVRQIIEQHGGNVSVDSTEGVGTTFTVRLPLASPNGAGETIGEHSPALSP